ALLEKACVVHYPRPNRPVRCLHGLDGVAGGVATDRLVAPCRGRREMNQSLVEGLRPLGPPTGPCSDRLHALALAVRKQAQRVHRKGRSLSFVPHLLTETVEEAIQPIARVFLHSLLGSRTGRPRQVSGTIGHSSVIRSSPRA